MEGRKGEWLSRRKLGRMVLRPRLSMAGGWGGGAHTLLPPRVPLLSLQPHGHGVYEWADGARYEGLFLEGKRHGEGQLTLPSGILYEGDWSRDQRNGVGVEVLPDGSKYDGGFADDARHGLGKMVWANEDSYEGKGHSRLLSTFLRVRSRQSRGGPPPTSLSRSLA